ncbi:MAG: hypothetical protein RLZ33_1244 [Bacteroidota bacterium]|jgi:hypothetical protein
MTNSIIYPVSKNWLRILATIGIVCILAGGIFVFIDEIKPIYFPTLFIGILLVLQYRSYYVFGYLRIDNAITINKGLKKTIIPVDTISSIVTENNTIQIILKNGKTHSIGLNFIQSDMINDLKNKIKTINTELKKR